jgi:hypothetical protein
LLLEPELEAEDRAEDRGFSITGNAILDALEMMPFASIRQIAEMTFLPPPTIFRRLTKSLRFVLKRLRSVPHRLSDLQERNQVIVSKELLKLLEFRRHHSWKYIITLREASFYLSLDHESIWLSPEDETPQRERQIVSFSTMILTVVGNKH